MPSDERFTAEVGRSDPVHLFSVRPTHTGAAFDILLNGTVEIEQQYGAEREEGDGGRDGDDSGECEGVMKVTMVGKTVD